jgi:ABC-type glycerol-3-phosphate transport system substrate-binding protein
MINYSLSRRRFMQLSALAAGSAALAACTPAAAPTGATQPGTETKEVRVMLSSWAVAEVPFDEMAQAFNEKHGDIEVKIDSSDDTTKLLAQIASGRVEWSGYGIITPFLDLVSNVSSGMIQPMDEMIAVSSEEGASALMDDMISTVRADASYEEKLYMIPYSFENITLNWRNDYFGEIGVTERPATWDEWYEVASELKSWGAEEEIMPASFVGSLWTDAGALIASAMENPYNSEGLLDWMAPEAIGALQFYRKMVMEELTPPHGFDGWLESFQRGKIASVQAQSSRGVWGQNIHGADTWTTSPIATREAGSGSGTVYWGNGLGVVNQAPHPQEMVDFLVYAMGPANEAFQKAVIVSGKTPVYNSSYDQIINTDPGFEQYKWMIGMRDDVTNSLPVPRNTFYLIQHQQYQRRIVEFIDDTSMTPEQCAQLILDDSLAEIDKQQIR